MKKSSRMSVFNKYDGKYAYCGNPIKYSEMQVDHALPKAKKHWLESEEMRKSLNIDFTDIDDLKNLMPSCSRCNHYKRAMTVEELREHLSTLHKRIESWYINKVGIDYGIIKLNPFDNIFYFEKQEQL